VLTNVKTRGTFGEIQLSSLLEQVLSPGQYDANVETRKGSGQRVEFALKLPGRDGTPDGMVWLPLDAKFPQRIICGWSRPRSPGMPWLPARHTNSWREACV